MAEPTRLVPLARCVALQGMADVREALEEWSKLGFSTCFFWGRRPNGSMLFERVTSSTTDSEIMLCIAALHRELHLLELELDERSFEVDPCPDPDQPA